jgi:hypothetical protein
MVSSDIRTKILHPNLPYFSEPEGLSAVSQEPVIGSSLKSDISSPYPHFLPSVPRSSKCCLPFRHNAVLWIGVNVSEAADSSETFVSIS